MPLFLAKALLAAVELLQKLLNRPGGDEPGERPRGLETQAQIAEGIDRDQFIEFEKVIESFDRGDFSFRRAGFVVGGQAVNEPARGFLIQLADRFFELLPLQKGMKLTEVDRIGFDRFLVQSLFILTMIQKSLRVSRKVLHYIYIF